MKKLIFSLLFLTVFSLSHSIPVFAQIESLHLDDNNGQNESWMYFAHTALNNPNQNSLELNLWFRDVGDTDIRLQRVRYDMTFLKALQMGIQSNSYSVDEKSASEHHHSSYASAKYTVVDQSISAVSIAVGVRKRLYWNRDNVEFNTGKSTDDKNDTQNNITVFAASTGGVRISALDILGNFYIDNQSITIGAKLNLTPEIKVIFDNVYYTYENPVVSSDSAIGFQFYNPMGAVSTIAFQTETEQILLGAGFNW